MTPGATRGQRPAVCVQHTPMIGILVGARRVGDTAIRTGPIGPARLVNPLKRRLPVGDVGWCRKKRN